MEFRVADTFNDSLSKLSAEEQKMPCLIDWSGCPIVERDSEKLDGTPTVRGIRITPTPS